jgi:hypothetical protein
MLRNHCLSLTLAAIAVLMVPAAANADTLFSDFGSGLAHDSSGAGAYIVPAYNWYQVPAAEFTAGGGITGDTFSVTQIDVAVDRRFETYTGTFFLKVYDRKTNAGTFDTPGSLLYTSGILTATELYTGPIGTSTTGIVTDGNVSGLSLISGNTYFMSVAPVSGSDLAWLRNSVGTTGLLEDYDGTQWTSFATTDLPAFDVQGTPIPEPSSLLLFGPVAGLALLRSRRTSSKSQGS